MAARPSSQFRCGGMAVVCAVLVTGCVWFGRKKPEDGPPPYIRQPAGVVVHVNAPEQYVIFTSSVRFAPGLVLNGMREGRKVASLRVHRLARPPRYAADLLEGAVQVGDLVELPSPP